MSEVPLYVQHLSTGIGHFSSIRVGNWSRYARISGADVEGYLAHRKDYEGTSDFTCRVKSEAEPYMVNHLF